MTQYRKVAIGEYGKRFYDPPQTRNALYQRIRRGLIPSSQVVREGRRIYILVAVEAA